MLHSPTSAAQTQRARLFKEALAQLCDLWYVKFTITAVGLRRPQWMNSGDDLAQFKLSPRAEKPLEIADFRRAARSMEGSADLGAQLFCTLLRALGVEARLVASLQPLGFAAVAEIPTPRKKSNVKVTVYANASDDEQDSGHAAAADANTSSPTPRRRIGRIGQSRATTNTAADLGKPPPALVNRSKRVQRPAHPVFWVEAFDEATQKWIAVDPMATKSVNKPAQIEPAFNDAENSMAYAIAFEEDGTAKDLTRRYAKAYNAKTRRLRVESTEGGQQWMKRTLKPLKKHRVQDRDQIEDADLAARAASEGMPRNVQDFKDHPYYALERHLRRNEVLHPKQEVGRIAVGASAATRFETVYRRRDVHVVRSAAKWFRLGQQIKIGEQPLKYVRTRQVRGREPSLDPDSEAAQTALYALFQTDLYIPDPVINGHIPKNSYGNVDVYVPSMIPAGAVHVRAPDAKLAAKLLNVDYADAVTGFQFKGRHGTAVVEGIIVASEFRDAVEAVLDGMAYAKAEAMETSRSAEALRLWRRFLVGMRVVQRVRGYRKHGVGDEEESTAIGGSQEELDQEMAQHRGRSPGFDGGGGFMVNSERDNMPVAAATMAQRQLPSELGDNSDDALHDDYYDNGRGGFVPGSETGGEIGEEVISQRGVPSLTREPSLFGLERFDIRMAMPLFQDGHDEYAGGGFVFTEAEGVCVPEGARTGPIPSPTSPSSFLNKESLADQDSIHEQEVSLGHQAQPASPPSHTITSSSVTMAIDPAPVHKAVGADRSQPSPVASSTSSGFDDGLLLDDPEDEDAEPEWLL
ncbi:Rad4-domain-containing protein [Venturia nashicola]|uniref:Rad4-domain-containing protein n=1 Tax=Venturia nashicola TaxID=86259 RepID=A0A4Z1NZF4_9PEZI|nr:Rad4-domain-containing protein [Venturia nashicola]